MHAIKIIATAGPATITIAQVAKASGAPVGSIYHRFASIDEILAEAWIQTTTEFQKGFAETLKVDPDGLAGALNTVKWSRQNPYKARMLLGYSRQDIIRKKVSRVLKQQITRLHRQLQVTLGHFISESQNLNQMDPDEALFALVYMPYAAVRPYLSQKKAIPDSVTGMVRRAFIAITQNEY